MRQFAFEYRGSLILQQVVREIPWGHNLAILSKIKAQEERFWYIQKTIENGWSRNVLVHQIETDFYGRQGKSKLKPPVPPQPRSKRGRILLCSPDKFSPKLFYKAPFGVHRILEDCLGNFHGKIRFYNPK